MSFLFLYSNGVQRFEYGAFGFLKRFIFKLGLILFIAIIFMVTTICQMHYICCCMLAFIQSNK